MVEKELAADEEHDDAKKVSELRKLVKVANIDAPTARELKRRQAEERLIGTLWKLKNGQTRFLAENRTQKFPSKAYGNWAMTDAITVLIQGDKAHDPLYIWKFNSELTKCKLLKFEANKDYKNEAVMVGSRSSR